MRLLVITNNSGQHGISNFDVLLEELKSLVNLTIWDTPGRLKEILQFIEQPDFILINEFGEGFTPPITGINEVSIPCGIYSSDINYDIDERKRGIECLNIQYIFSRYRDRFYEWYPQFYKRLIWIPQHVNTNMFKDLGLKKNLDYLLAGWVDKNCHPLRCKIIKAMGQEPGFHSQVYHGCNDIWTEERIGLTNAISHAEKINRAKIFITCDTVCRYPLPIYFQVLACNTLLLAPISQELKDLGFVDGKHFVAIDEYSDFVEKARYYLNHEKERLTIANQGRDMVIRNHTTTIRAQQLVECIQNLLN